METMRVKSFSESLKYDYAVCEIKDCNNKSEKLAMTETRFVDFCMEHYNIYILEKK